MFFTTRTGSVYVIDTSNRTISSESFLKPNFRRIFGGATTIPYLCMGPVIKGLPCDVVLLGNIKMTTSAVENSHA